MDWTRIEKRVNNIKGMDISESQNLANLVRLVADLTQESVGAYRLTGIDDILLKIVVQSAAWYERRSPFRAERAGALLLHKETPPPTKEENG